MKGFSLVEIMVVVAIVGIMASSVVVGFNSFGETVRMRETAGVITDTLMNLELDMIRRDYKKQTVHFEPDYLVIEAEVEAQTLPLSWEGPGKGTCTEGQERLVIDNSTNPSPVYLAQRDQYGNNIEINAIPTSTEGEECVEFFDSEETEIQYQVFSGAQESQIIRFKHFNIRRDGSENLPYLDGNNYTLEISAPYAAKKYLENGGVPSGSVVLTLKNDDGDEEDITLQE